MSRVKTSRPPTTAAHTTAPSLYEPLDWAFVRAPLLPIESYLGLHERSGATVQDPLPLHTTNGTQRDVIGGNPYIRRAIAVGSLELFEALDRRSLPGPAAARRQAKLLRYLIRMSTRPTPFGLFAGVALAQWGAVTDLTVDGSSPTMRTRPDMAWLLNFVLVQEARPEVRHQLRLVAHPAAFVHGGRVFLAERAPTSDGPVPPAVSLRATGVVQRALAAARRPIAYAHLAEMVLRSTPGATPEKVEALLTELWQQTLLLTDLRPPLTVADPAAYVLERLRAIPAAHDAVAECEAVVEIAAAWNALPAEDDVPALRHLIATAKQLLPSAPHLPLQVDMALGLRGQQLAATVGQEAARAAELLLRLSPVPLGQGPLAGYQRAFEGRYGHTREVPLLELLDATTGLGSPTNYGTSGNMNSAKSAQRAQSLRDLAVRALHARQLVVDLDDETLAQLETWSPSVETAPVSLDIYAFIAATSAAAVDAGDFQLIVGPNLGATAAGRNLGRFADLLVPAAPAALARTALAEAVRAPEQLWAELVYLPRRFRSANVVIRPQIRTHEIVIGTSPGVDADHVIPLDELMVGVRNGRFYLRWVPHNKEIVVCAGHMLNNHQAPSIVRFLAEVNRSGTAHFSTFDWGPAELFPCLPRVQVGRIVLRPAQWRIDSLLRSQELQPTAPEHCGVMLRRWREQWQVPRYVHLSVGDNRLVLDLDDPAQAEELWNEVRSIKQGGAVVVQELLPALDQVWTPRMDGHALVEFVVPLVLREGARQTAAANDGTGSQRPPVKLPAVVPARVLGTISRLRPPGSEWLFAKLYSPRAFEEEVIGEPLRTFAAQVCSAGWADDWFFIRYADPEPHLRIRFRGDPQRLLQHVMPEFCAWATELMSDGQCLKFCFDTYDRELERYGGLAGTALAEAIFGADSRTSASLLHLLRSGVVPADRTELAVLTIDELLAALGLAEPARLAWYHAQVVSRHEAGAEYRQRKGALRSLLSDPRRHLENHGEAAVWQVVADRRAAIVPVAQQLTALAECGELSQPLDHVYRSLVHLHCNRLLGSGSAPENRLLGLLLRTREGLERAPVHTH